MTLLRNAVTELSGDFIKDCATCDLPDGTFCKANKALDRLLVILDGLVGDNILTSSSVSSVLSKCISCDSAFLALVVLLQPIVSSPRCLLTWS
jgi:hypothetical protein